MTTPVRSLFCCVAGVAMVAALASCSSAAGNGQTDRIASTVATAISDPRQGSADGLVRAALSTSAAESSTLTVVEAEDIRARKIAGPLARLVFRIHLEGSLSGFVRTEPITACYEAEFNFYGIIGNPDRTNCPAGAKAIVPPPLPAKQRAVIPAGFDTTLTSLLVALPAAPLAGDVKARITGRLPAPAVDPGTGLRNLPPTVDTAVSGVDVGVSLWEGKGRACLLGARVGGLVTVWRPDRIQLQPGELSCDPQTALRLQGTRPPS